MRLLSVVGARPQFVKVAVIADALRTQVRAAGVDHRLLHTGQHYDSGLSDSFFSELHIPTPDCNLGVGSGGHGEQTGRMLGMIEAALDQWRPDAVIVYGDTNSTVAAALAAAKMDIDVIHIEAGMRSFNRNMPEELNRVVTDHLSDLLLCPTAQAMANAGREGLAERCRLTGDIMLDLLLEHVGKAPSHPLAVRPFALITVHRAENTDTPERRAAFLRILEQMPMTVILPMHPRLRARLAGEDLRRIERIRHVHLIEPCSYGEMLALERDARVILTDSGGVQKEAYFLSVPCLTLRNETEWTETLTGGWNRVIGMNPEAALAAANSLLAGNGYLPQGSPDLAQFGGGHAAAVTIQTILDALGDVHA